MRAWWRWLVVFVVGAVSLGAALAAGVWLARVSISDGENPVFAVTLASLIALGFGWATAHLPVYVYALFARQERVLARRRHRQRSHARLESFFDGA